MRMVISRKAGCTVVSPSDAERVFNLPMIVELDERDDYGEDRWIGTGMLDGRVVVIVYTEPDEETIRIISL